MDKKNSPGSGNPVVIALKYIYGPLVAKTAPLPPPLAYGLPILVTILLIAVLKAALPTNIAWLLALAIVAPLAGYIATLVLVRGQPVPPPPAPWADIESPKSEQFVDRTIDCSGSANGIPPNMHLWLVVEERKYIWPKEGEVIVNKQGKWKHRIYEDGGAQQFSVSLLMAAPQANDLIRNWFEIAKLTKEYSTLTGIPGTSRISRVDGLRLKPRHRTVAAV